MPISFTIFWHSQCKIRGWGVGWLFQLNANLLLLNHFFQNFQDHCRMSNSEWALISPKINKFLDLFHFKSIISHTFLTKKWKVLCHKKIRMELSLSILSYTKFWIWSVVRSVPTILFADPDPSKSMYFQCIFDKIDQLWVPPVSKWRLKWTWKLIFLVMSWVDFGLMEHDHQELLHCHGWPLSKTHVPEKENQDLGTSRVRHLSKPHWPHGPPCGHFGFMRFS